MIYPVPHRKIGKRDQLHAVKHREVHDFADAGKRENGGSSVSCKRTEQERKHFRHPFGIVTDDSDHKQNGMR